MNKLKLLRLSTLPKDCSAPCLSLLGLLQQIATCWVVLTTEISLSSLEAKKEVQDQGACRGGFILRPLSPWLVGRHHLSPCVLTDPLVHWGRESNNKKTWRTGVKLSSCKDPDPIRSGPLLITSFNRKLEALAPNTATLGVRASPCDFLGGWGVGYTQYSDHNVIFVFLIHQKFQYLLPFINYPHRPATV